MSHKPRNYHGKRIIEMGKLVDDTQEITRGGLLPFRIDGANSLEFLLIKPKITPGHPDGLPLFQIARSNLMLKNKGNETAMETPLETALRNGLQEAGLTLGGIVKLLDMGAYQTRSRTNEYPAMYIYAAQVKKGTRLRTPTHSAEAKWMPISGNEDQIRPNHLPILLDVADEIRWFMQQEKVQIQR